MLCSLYRLSTRGAISPSRVGIMLSLLPHYLTQYSACGRLSISGLFIQIFFNCFIPRADLRLFLERKCPGLICKIASVFPIAFIFFPFHLGSAQGKAQVLMLTGKALNVTPDYSPKAEELLSKAVKLEPKLVEAWNQLGEVYWKKGDIASAHTCFSGALTHVSHLLYSWKTQMGKMRLFWFYEFP